MSRDFLCRANAVLAVVLAVLYGAWWLFEGASLAALNIAALLFAAVPLLMLAPGLWSGSRFVTTLAGLLVPFHFAFAVMELIANPAVRGWVALQTLLAFLLFVAIMATLRQVKTAR